MEPSRRSNVFYIFMYKGFTVDFDSAHIKDDQIKWFQ